MIRLPLIITESEKPPKTESWSAVAGKGLLLIATILFWIYVLLPMLDQP